MYKKNLMNSGSRSFLENFILHNVRNMFPLSGPLYIIHVLLCVAGVPYYLCKLPIILENEILGFLLPCIYRPFKT